MTDQPNPNPQEIKALEAQCGAYQVIVCDYEGCSRDSLNPVVHTHRFDDIEDAMNYAQKKRSVWRSVLVTQGDVTEQYAAFMGAKARALVLGALPPLVSDARRGR